MSAPAKATKTDSSAKSDTHQSPAGRSAPVYTNATSGATLSSEAGNLAVQQLFRAGAIKTKLTISQPDDPDEQEADRVADRIMRMEDPDHASSSGAIQHQPNVRDSTGPIPDDSPQEQLLQRNQNTDASSRNSPTYTRIARLHGGGEPLSRSALAFFEPRFARSLGGVRVHTGKEAANSARAIQARAYTSGQNVVFGAGEYSPDSYEGRKLLAHELTHTLQQSLSSHEAIHRNSINQCITSSYASALDDGELMYEIQLLEGAVTNADRSSVADGLMQENLTVLRNEYFSRNPGTHTANSGLESPDLDTSLSCDRGGSLSSDLSLIPEGGTEINSVGIVAWDGEPQLRLRSSPTTEGSDNVITTLPFNTRLQVIKSFPGDWYFISAPSGELGYVSSIYININLPEPNARLHRVQSGVSGTAIGIAEQYFSEYAHDWGQDLRFYVNVLAWANHISVPDTVTGWRSVHFQAGQLIWVPSQRFAYSLKSVVNSGSYSHNIAEFIGIAGFIDRIEQLMDDFRTAVVLSRHYIVDAIARRLEEALWGMVQGLVILLLGAVALLAITTAIGAAIGALAGGVGAAPGAAAGFEVGMVIIEWIGLGMLLVWIGQSVAQLASAFGEFLGSVWNAEGNREILDLAAQQFADAIALLIAKLFEALLMFVMAQGLPRGIELLRGTRLGRALGETRAVEWLTQRHAAIESGEAPLPSPREVISTLRGTGRVGAERAAVTRAGNHQAFDALPPDRLPANLPEGHFWMRTPEGEWVLMRESGAQPVDFELTVYSDAAGNTNYVLRTGDRMIQSDALTRTGSTYESSTRLPEDLSATGADNPYRDPITGEVWDKGHGVDFADTLEGPGVRSSATDPANFTPQTSWWNQGPRNSLVGRIRNGHAATGRLGGGGYREMAVYAENPPVTADGTPIPREFVFVETTRAGAPVRAWRIPNRAGAGTRSLSSIDSLEISLGEVPQVMLRTSVPTVPSGSGPAFAPFVIYGVPGDDESSETGLCSVEDSSAPQFCE